MTSTPLDDQLLTLVGKTITITRHKDVPGYEEKHTGVLGFVGRVQVTIASQTEQPRAPGTWKLVSGTEEFRFSGGDDWIVSF